MKFRFSHTYAAYSCLKCKKHVQASSGGPNWSLFYLLFAAGMTVPWWAFATFGPLKLPWFYFPGYLAAELLLFYPIGFAWGWLSIFASLFSLIFKGASSSKCPECGSAPSFNGRYFNDNEKPNINDFLMLGVYVAINIGIGVLAASWTERL